MNTGTITPDSINANRDNGFSIIKYTGTGVSATVGHGLTQPPELIIAKNLDTAGGSGTYDGWPVYVSAIGNDHLLNLKSSAAKDSTGGTWDSTTPTSTVFSVKDNADNNKSGDNIIAYCFHSVAGYQKIGTYTGKQGGSFTFTVDCGFRPKFVMIKRADGTGNWVIIDEPRGSGSIRIYPNNANGGDTGQGESFSSTGFNPRTSSTADTNIDGATYIFLAFAYR